MPSPRHSRALESDPAFAAEALALPSETWLGDQMEVIDPDAVHRVRRQFRRVLAQALRQPLEALLSAARRTPGRMPPSRWPWGGVRCAIWCSAT
jgi:aminopeptidase N